MITWSRFMGQSKIMGQMLEQGSSRLAVLASSDGAILWTALLAVVSLGLLLGFLPQKKNLPPGPRAPPIVGSLFSLGKLPYKSLRALALQHGELMYLRMGSIPCVVVSSGAMAREIVTNHDVEFAHRPTRLFSHILFNKKDIATSSSGPAWRHLRTICSSQFFTKKRIALYEAGRAEEIHSLIRLILRKAPSSSVNLRFQLRNTATNIISRMVFNKRLFGEECNDEEAKAYQEILSLHFRSYGVFVISDYFPALGLLTNLQGTREKMQKVVERINKKMDEIINFDDRKKRSMNIENHKPEKDFVDLLLATPSQDGSGTLDHETIRGIVMNMLFAGTETQSTTLEWAMAHLLRHPDVMERAQAELDQVVGTQRRVQESDLEQLPYLEAVMKEVSRIQPGAPLAIHHESRAPCRVAGFHLPAKTRLIFNIHSIHRDCDRPDEFNPSRFLTTPNQLQFMPFGAGRRICPGMPLANVNMPHLLAHLLHCFDWRLPEGQNPQELDMSETFDGVTAPRLHPLLTIATPRKPAFLY